MNMEDVKLHIALLSSPGMGHLIPILELGHRLASSFNLKITVFVVSTDAPTVQSQLDQEYSSYKKVLDIVLLPQIELSNLMDSSIAILSKIFMIMRESVKLLRSVIASMDINHRFKLLRSAILSNRHDPSIHDNYRRMGIELGRADGVLVNAWEALEPGTLRALRDPKAMGRHIESCRVFTIGPVVRRSSSTEHDSRLNNNVLNWLDQQPAESVLYVSFGSGGTLSVDQLTELAWGLEKSVCRFIWVVRPPAKDTVSGSWFKLGKRTDTTPGYLPDGFITRTRDKGLVVSMWALQSEVLAHPSVGGFLSHCGWNSALESISNGVPMIAWPLYAEQKMNATLLVEQLGTAVKHRKASSCGVVGQDEIEVAVRTVMDKGGIEGKRLRTRAHELKRGVDEALRDGGSSSQMLSRLVKEIEYGRRRSTEFGTNSNNKKL